METQVVQALHPLVARSLKHLENKKPGPTGLMSHTLTKCLVISVSPASLHRAVQLTDRLLKAVEAKGYKVSPRQGDEAGVAIIVGNQSIPLRLEEELDRLKHQPSDYELNRKKRESWYDIPEWDFVPSGRLKFVMENASGGRRNWGEGKRWKHEERIDKLVEGLESAAQGLEKVRLEREEWHRKYQEEQRLREERARLAAEEKASVEQVANQIRRWELAKSIRQYSSEIKDLMVKHEMTSEVENMKSWISWVDDYANKIDPVARTQVKFATGKMPDLPQLPDGLLGVRRP